MKRQNPQQNPREPKKGSFYAIHGTGGFSINRPVNKIQVQPIPNIGKHDVTNCVQIQFPANVLNTLIQNDEARIDIETLISNITDKSILSVGNYENLYENYMQYVNGKLGHVFNSSILNEQSRISIQQGFNSKTMTDMLRTSQVAGEWRIYDIAKTMQNVRKLNIFGNAKRDSSGFLPGDMIYIDSGFSMTLSVYLFTDAIYSAFMGREQKDQDIFVKTYDSNVLLFLTP